MKILIIKTSSLGDIIQSFPVISYLRTRFPHAQIDWVVEAPFAELLEAHPGVDHVIRIDTKQWRGALWNRSHIQQIRAFRQSLCQEKYDVAFDLQSNIKSGLIMWQVKAEHKVGFGWKTAHEWPNVWLTKEHYNPPAGLNIRDDYLFVVQRFFGDPESYEAPGVLLSLSVTQEENLSCLLENPQLEGRKKVLVCPGSAWKNKQMTLKAICHLLQSIQSKLQNIFLFTYGSEEERLFVGHLHDAFADTSILVDKLDLPVLQNFMDQMDLVVAMDSLPLHLAGTTSVPTLSVFGPSLAQKFKPKGSLHFAFQGTCPYGKTFPKRCPILRTCSTGSCIRHLTGQEVYEAWLKE